MQIIDKFKANTIPVSFEIFPPKGDLPLRQAESIMEKLAALDPAFISVTCSAGGSSNSSHTLDVAKLAKDQFDLTSMAHLTCANASLSAIKDALRELKDAGIENILALRGDAFKEYSSHDFAFAKDLIPLVVQAGFCVGAAAYPEGHIDCLDFGASICHLKEKEDAGAQFFVTQLFFENEQGFRFLEAARNAGIKAPITMGIMPFLSKAQIERMVFMCGASLPSRVIKLLARWENDPISLRKAGIDYACEQLVGLAEGGVDGLHVYTMNNPDIAIAAVEALADYR